MKSVLLILFATVLACEAGWKEGFYSARDDDGQLTKLWDELGKADHDLEYFGNDELWVGIGAEDDGAIDPVTHPLSKLSHYFKRQKHKGLVVVMFHKNAPGKKTLKEAVTELNEFFFSRGYRRVILTGAHSMGTYIYSDKTKEEQDGGWQPATRPESKSEGGDKHQPEEEKALPVAGCQASTFAADLSYPNPL